jgi:hypothetical protein
MRTHTASTFRQLENGHISIEDVLRKPPHTLKKVSVYDVLRRSPGLGKVGSEKLLMRLEVWPLTTLGELSLQERKKILEHLPPRARH